MDSLLYHCEDGIATLTFNQPRIRNPLDAATGAALDDHLARITRDDSVRAVIVAGSGGVFCAGGDIRAMTATPPRTSGQWHTRMRGAHRIVHAMQALDKPIIAAVDGAAFGAGFGIALMCDIVIASDRARFCMSFGRLGLVPDYAALYTLPRVVGVQRAKEIMFSTREIAADEAVRLGIAMESVPADGLLARAQAVARSFATASPAAVAMTKDALNASMGTDLATLLQMEAAAQAVAGTSDYHREAVRRFMAKEPLAFDWAPPPAPASGNTAPQ